jgi:hypothetical protein
MMPRFNSYIKNLLISDVYKAIILDTNFINSNPDGTDFPLS